MNKTRCNVKLELPSDHNYVFLVNSILTYFSFKLFREFKSWIKNAYI